MATVRKRHWVTAAGAERTAWVATYTDSAGTRRLKTFPTKKAASEWLVQTGAELAKGTHTPESTSATVAEAARLWLQRCEGEGLERSTLVQYRTHVDLHILPLIGREKLARLTVPRVEQFKDVLLATRSRALARKVLASLKAILKDALRRGLVAQNVALAVTVGTSSRHDERPEVGRDIPSPAEVGDLLRAAEATRWRPFLVVAVFTGLRASELRGLTWENVDLDARVLRVRQRADRWGTIGRPKSKGSRRDIPMAPIVVNALREWRLACPKGELGLVFPAGSGRVSNYANTRARLTLIHRRAGLTVAQVDAEGRPVVDRKGRPVLVPKYALHSLRHFFASWLIDQGFSAKRVQSLLGHANIGMTLDTYTHLFPQEDDHARFEAGELAIVGR
jgi:integrase